MVEVTLAEAKVAVRELLTETDLIPYLEGPPGVGKSDCVYQIAQEQKWSGVKEIRLALCDPTDVKGLPWIDKTPWNGGTKARARWAPMGELPDPEVDGETGIIFVDEYAQAVPSVQAALSQMFLLHRIADWYQPKGWKVVAAGNPPGTGNVTYQMPVLMRTRMQWFHITPSLDAWKEWAWQQGIDEMVIAFLNFKQDLLYRFTGKENAHPNPRSWARVSVLLKALPGSSLLDKHIAATIGEGPAAEFMAFRELRHRLPDVEKIFAGQDIVPKDASILYALMGALVGECKRRGKGTVPRMFGYSEALQAEYAVLLIKDLARAMGRQVILSAEGGKKWAGKFRDVII